MSINESSKFVTIKVAAKMLGVSALTLRNWDKKKKLAAFRHPINNYRVYRLEDIESFINKIEDGNKPRRLHVEFLGDDGDSDEDELKI